MGKMISDRFSDDRRCWKRGKFLVGGVTAKLYGGWRGRGFLYSN